MRAAARCLQAQPARIRPRLNAPSQLPADTTTEVDLQVQELMNLAVRNPIPPHRTRWSSCVRRLWNLRGMINPEVAASISEQYVRHTDCLFALDGKALEFVQFSQDAGFYSASMDTVADQCFYSALALQPVPELVASVVDPEKWDPVRKMRVAFALGCQQDSMSHLPEVAPLGRKLAEDCVARLRVQKRVTRQDSYVAAASSLWNCESDLWRKFSQVDFLEWELPYLVMLDRCGLQSPDLTALLRGRLSISAARDAAVTPRELLDSIRICIAMRHPDTIDPYFRILANSTDVLKKCERSAGAWLLDKVQGTPYDSELLQYLRREDWLNRPHRSNISWLRGHGFPSKTGRKTEERPRNHQLSGIKAEGVMQSPISRR